MEQATEVIIICTGCSSQLDGKLANVDERLVVAVDPCWNCTARQEPGNDKVRSKADDSR